MKLSEYTAKRGAKVQLARALGVPYPSISNWAAGKRPIPIEYGWPIERETGGLVTRKDLFPEKWGEIWPELVSEDSSPLSP